MALPSTAPCRSPSQVRDERELGPPKTAAILSAATVPAVSASTADVSTAQELFDAVSSPSVTRIRLLANIHLADLHGRAENPQNVAGMVASPAVAVANAEAIATARNGSMGAAVSTTPTPTPTPQPTPPAFRWRAWRHGSLYSWLPPVARSLEVEGNCNHPEKGRVLCVIDGGGSNRIFAVVANGNTTFRHVEFRAGATHPLHPEDPASAEDQEVEHLGSAVLMDYLATGTLINCTFRSNSANIDSGTRSLSDASPGGALGLQGSLRVVVTDCLFLNNSAAGGPNDIIGQAYSTLIVDRTQFRRNLLDSQSTYSVGLYPQGSVFRTTMSIFNSEFRGNAETKQAGGGLFLTGGSTATLVNVFFLDIFVSPERTVAAVVLSNQARGYFSGVIVRRCVSQGIGTSPGILVQENSELELHQSTIAGNRGGGAALVVEDSRANIISTLMEKNKGYTNGSCISAAGSIVQAHNVTMRDSTALRGGCVWATGGLLYIWYSTLSNCHADSQGGGLMLDNQRDSGSITMGALYHTTIANCSADISGGGLLAADLLDISTPRPGINVEQRVNLVVSSCDFVNNTVGALGGALLTTASAIFMDNTRFVMNSAAVVGNNMWLKHTTLIMVNVYGGASLAAAVSDSSSTSCDLVVYDDSCNVYSTTTLAQGDNGQMTKCGEVATSCSPLACSINRRPTWPISSGCQIDRADLLQQDMACLTFETLRGYEFAITKKNPLQTCGSMQCSTDDFLEVEECFEPCDEEPDPGTDDGFGDFEPSEDGTCPDSMSANYSLGPSSQVHPLEVRDSPKNTTAPEMSSYMVGVLSVDKTANPEQINNGVASYLYGNYQGPWRLCSRGFCVQPLQDQGVFVQAINASQGPVWEAILSIPGSAKLEVAGRAVADDEGRMYMALRFQAAELSERGDSGVLSLQLVADAKEDLQSIQLQLAPQSCLYLVVMRDSQVKLMNQVDLVSQGSLDCPALDVSSNGRLLALAGTFTGDIISQGLLLTSSLMGKAQSGFVVVLESRGTDKAVRPIIANTIEVGAIDSSITVSTVSLGVDSNALDLTGSYQGYLVASWTSSSGLSAFHPLPAAFVLRLALNARQSDNQYPGDEIWSHSLSFPSTVSHSATARQRNGSLFFGGFYKVGELSMRWLAGAVAPSGDIEWIQYSSFAGLNTWVRDLQITSSGDLLKLLVNRDPVGNAGTMDIQVITLCAKTGSVMDQTGVQMTNTLDIELAAGLDLTPWASNGSACLYPDCTLLTTANVLSGSRSAVIINPEAVAQQPYSSPGLQGVSSSPWMRIGSRSLTVPPSEWSWAVTVAIFAAAVLGATTLATLCFWGCFYGPQTMQRCRHAKAAGEGGDARDSPVEHGGPGSPGGSTMTPEDRIKDSEEQAFRDWDSHSETVSRQASHKPVKTLRAEVSVSPLGKGYLSVAASASPGVPAAEHTIEMGASSEAAEEQKEQMAEVTRSRVSFVDQPEILDMYKERTWDGISPDGDEEEEEEEEEGSDGQLTYVLAQIDTPRGLSQQGISPDSSGCGWLGQQSGTYSGITDLSAATPTSEDGGGALPFSFSSLDSRLMMSTLSGGPITALEPSEGWTSSLDGALPSPHGPGDPHRDPISRSGPPWFPLEATTPQGKHCISGTLGQEDGWPSVDLSQLFEAMGHQQPGTPPVGRGGGGGHREPSSPGFSLPTLSRDSSSWLGDVASSSSGPLGSRSMMPSRLDQQQPHLLQRQQQQQPEASSGYPPADSSIAAATASKEEGEEEGQGWPATGGE
eukprot:CAMPEP_0117660520 /NCGR_PEP_ID=MMETSP0804-20121206/7012_1 /TAXON_ID=1074897 /ORGANISM="Tetraselmis astigmatica, Strain CCMP880" /LENGTH=1760 /DNA_ID=CAMNT_0005467255 /DNA_START=361 /DNA_END=5643 /DNA_ORIENTATION=+